MFSESVSGRFYKAGIEISKRNNNRYVSGMSENSLAYSKSIQEDMIIGDEQDRGEESSLMSNSL